MWVDLICLVELKNQRKFQILNDSTSLDPHAHFNLLHSTFSFAFPVQSCIFCQQGLIFDTVLLIKQTLSFYFRFLYIFAKLGTTYSLLWESIICIIYQLNNKYLNYLPVEQLIFEVWTNCFYKVYSILPLLWSF